ncbi:MAG: hypothetical protein M3O74_13900 [Pseudomonadota bacterium]|nr:hypothetical protein [Pseudomonadota bacterium]
MTAALKRIVVASYQTTDGKTFDKKDDAAKHQRELDRKAKLEELVAGQFQHSPDNMRYLDAATVGDVARFIIENADALREILPKRAKPVAPVEAVAHADGDSAIAGNVATLAAA